MTLGIVDYIFLALMSGLALTALGLGIYAAFAFRELPGHCLDMREEGEK